MIGFFFGNLLFPSLCAHRTISATSVGSNPVWYLYAAAWSAPIAVYVSLLCSLLVGDIVISGGTNIVTARVSFSPGTYPVDVDASGTIGIPAIDSMKNCSASCTSSNVTFVSCSGAMVCLILCIFLWQGR